MRKILLLLFLFTGLLSFSQNKNYWIEFTDKSNKTINWDNANEYLSEKAIERRLLFNIPLSHHDLPITNQYLNEIQNIDNQLVIKGKSKWLNAVLVNCNEAIAQEIATLTFVKNVVLVSSNNKTTNSFQDKLTTEFSELSANLNGEAGYYEPTIQLMNGNFLHNLGFKGQTIDIAVMDNGFDQVDSLYYFKNGRDNLLIQAGYNFVDDTTDVYSRGKHGTNVLSTMLANIPDTLVGTAPLASYTLFVTENNQAEGLQEEINWALAAEWADSALGTHLILTTSLGYSTGFDDPSTNHTYAEMDGNTTIISRAADIAASKGILVVNSAGNEGDDAWRYITAPADGDSVLTIGAVQLDETAAFFSSFGPTSDGQLKPEVSAHGFEVPVVDVDGLIKLASGTSFSCPIVSGMCACLWEAFPEMTNMDIYEAVVKSAHLYYLPEDQRGYGIPNFELAYQLLSKKQAALASGQLVISPNPASDKLQIFLDGWEEGAIRVLISDLSGKIWQQSNAITTTGLLNINVLDLPKGAYVVQLQQGKNKLSKKFVR